MSIDKVIHELDGYDVTMHFEGELRMLNRLCDGITEGVIVTIGSYRGQSDCAIALHAHVPVYAIDPRQTWEGESRAFGDLDRVFWMENIMSLGLAARVRPINLPSLDVAKIWTEPISFLFVDGNHIEVDDDLKAWMPFVVDGGLVAVHDNNGPAIIAAVTNRDDIVEIERSNLTTVYRKEPLYEPYAYDDLTLMVRKGPYNHDDKYVLGEVRSYDIGEDVPHTILDIGGHIGAFTAWMKQKFPKAEIVVVEPERSNWHVLYRNVAKLPSVNAIHGSVNYSNIDPMLVVDPVNSGCHRIVPRSQTLPGQAAIEVFSAHNTIEDIVEEMEWQTLDLLKIDCEGSEVDILTNCTDEVLQKTRRIVGEHHFGYDAFMDGIGQRLKSLGFDVSAESNPQAHSTFLAINRNFVGLETQRASVEKPKPAARKRK